MVNVLTLCVAVCGTLLIAVPTTTATFTDGLYTSNGTDILRVPQSGSQSEVTSVYKSNGGRIVGLAFSYGSGYVFWSDISLGKRGIYRTTTDSAGNFNTDNVVEIVSDDVLEVNGLTVDWISNHIYWTDGRKRSVEVAEFDGSNRRILVTEHLSQPRGIYADPINRYLFWNDQGYHQIERSRLDGSERQILVNNKTSNVNRWPNQMAVMDSKLYWVDSHDKTLKSRNIDGSGAITSVSLSRVTGTGHVYGLAISGNVAYISCWKSSASMIKVQLRNSALTVYNSGLSTGAVFSNVYISSQPSGNNPCAGRSCVLCLPKDTSYRCSCPSYGGKVLKNNQCVEPTNVVLYTLAESGYVGFYDPTATVNGDLYFVARSLRPVAVAYDPIQKYLYWSDVRERTIHRVPLDGSSKPVVLLDNNRGIGIVDGMALDYVNRRLYYTNVGSVKVDQDTYSWHKVETIRLDPSVTTPKIRTIVSSHADRPRAIAVDPTRGHLYYTDWGKTASVVRTLLDGSNPKVLKSGLEIDNPNGIAVINTKIYVTDSHYKTRVPSNARPSKDGSLYSMNLDGSGWTNVLSAAATKLKTPFGLTADVSGRKLYVSDWDKNAVFEVDVRSSAVTAREVISDVSLPMALQYTAVSAASSADACSSSLCDDICIKQSSSAICTCNSYKNRASSSNTCQVPSNYLLVSDMDGIKMLSLDRSSDKSVYVAAMGRPFFSNLVALTYDSASNTAYYSDVRRKAIYALFLSNSTSTEFYRVNHIIDGMTLHNGKLYWTDALVGSIASRDVNAATNVQHQILITGLDKPRAIAVTDSYIYWTEWGSAPRVARMSVSGSTAETVVSGLQWPNALFIRGNALYIADGHPTERRLFNCSLPDVNINDCRPVSQVNSDTVAHVYDIWISNNHDIMVYTDWKSEAVNMLSLTTGTLLNPLATGLMRPSQLLFVGSQSTSCSSHSCSDQCVPLFGSQQCVCNAGRTFNYSSSSCVATSSLSCTHDSSTYNVGSTNIEIPTCKSCQCLANTLYGSPGTLTCHSVQCPTLDCADAVTPSGQCCPRCQCESGIKITNCPSSELRVSLPASRDEVLYQFSAATRDCDDQGRRITTTITPEGDIYQWNGGTGYEVTVKASSEGLSDTCTFTIIPVDTTRPKITCPDDVLVYTSDDKTTVNWPSPRVSDNVGVDAGEVISSPARGSEFRVDTTTPVTYTATDRAGLKSSCTFNVQVMRQSAGNCIIPRLQRGHLSCSPTSNEFTCNVVCDTGYIHEPRNPLTQISCSGGKWTPEISNRPNFEWSTCVRSIAGTAQGSITVTAKDVCDSSGTLQRDYTEEVLEYHIDVNYLTYSLYKLRGEVDVTGCDGGRRRRRDADDVLITVTISGDFENKAGRRYIIQDITYILERIQEDLLKGFLVVPLRDENGIRSAAIVNPYSKERVGVSCREGSYSTGEVCILCPAGTHQSGSNCVACEAGTYNEKDGQSSCSRCPESKSSSPAGSVNFDQCTPADEFPLEIVIGVVVAVVLLIIIIVIIIVVVVKTCNGKSSRRERNVHENPTFHGDEGNYEDVKDKEADHTYEVLGEDQ